MDSSAALLIPREYYLDSSKFPLGELKEAKDVMLVFGAISIAVISIAYICWKIVKLQRQRELETCELFRAYESSLSFLREKPLDGELRSRCEALGREYYGEILPGPYGDRVRQLKLPDEMTKDFMLLREELLAEDLLLATQSSCKVESFSEIPRAS